MVGCPHLTAVTAKLHRSHLTSCRFSMAAIPFVLFPRCTRIAPSAGAIRNLLALILVWGYFDREDLRLRLVVNTIEKGEGDAAGRDGPC